MKTFFKHCFIILLFIGYFAQAGTSVKQAIVNGKDIVVGKKLDIKDDETYNARDYVAYELQVDLKYDRAFQKDKDISTYQWSYTINYDLYYKDEEQKLQVIPNQKLAISKSEDITEGVHIFSKIKDASVVITSVSGTFPENVSFSLLLKKEVIRELSATEILDLRLTAPSNGRGGCIYGDINFYWSHIQGAEKYELQWVFIDAYDKLSPDISNDYNKIFEYKEPVNVIVSKSEFDLKLAYPNGRIYARVRPLGYFPNGKEKTFQYGVWSPIIPLCVSAINQNFQSVVTYAEDGLHKKVVSYFDNTYRNTQTLTHLSTENLIIGAETKYNYEGAGVLNVMPAPLNTNDYYSLNYKENLNPFVNNQGKSAFDNTSVKQPLNSTSEGSSAQYYSPNNKVNSVHKEAIPNAEGYNYSLIEYDEKGRITNESGVGYEHQIHSDAGREIHFTRHLYGAPSKEFLNSLFGQNVGDVSHYQTHHVIDPNGEVSLTVLDQEQRVIISGLTGEGSKNLIDLTSNKPEDREESISSFYDATKKAYIAEHKQVNATPQKYTFNYSIQGIVNSFDQCAIYKGQLINDFSPQGYLYKKEFLETLTIPSNAGFSNWNDYLNPYKFQKVWAEKLLDKHPSYSSYNGTCPTGTVKTLCQACEYTLSFKIIDPDKIILYTKEEIITPSTCQTPTGKKEITITDIDFAKIGTYTIIKELKLTDNGLTVFMEGLKNMSGYPDQTTITNEINEYMVDESLCDNTIDDICEKAVKEQSPNLSGDALTQAINECVSNVIAKELSEGTNSKCEQILDQMKAQLSPGGWYFEHGSALVYNTNSLSTTDVVLTGLSDNVNISNQRVDLSSYQDILLDKDDNYKFKYASLNDAEKDAFVSLFIKDYVNDLVVIHPEYKYYRDCMWNRASDLYDLKMGQIKTWEEAKELGFLNPLDNNSEDYPISTKDPFFTDISIDTHEEEIVKYASVNDNSLFDYHLGKEKLTTIQTDIKEYKDEVALDYDFNGDGVKNKISLWEYVNIEKVLNEFHSEESISNDDKAWKLFQTNYLSLKEEYKQEVTKQVTALPLSQWKTTYGGEPTQITQVSQNQQATDIINNDPKKGTYSESNKDITYFNNKVQELQANDCAQLCQENVNYWYKEVLAAIKNNCNNTDITPTQETEIKNYLSAHCITSCGSGNPMALLLKEELNYQSLNNLKSYLQNQDLLTCNNTANTITLEQIFVNSAYNKSAVYQTTCYMGVSPTYFYLLNLVLKDLNIIKNKILQLTENESIQINTQAEEGKYFLLSQKAFVSHVSDYSTTLTIQKASNGFYIYKTGSPYILFHFPISQLENILNNNSLAIELNKQQQEKIIPPIESLNDEPADANSNPKTYNNASNMYVKVKMNTNDYFYINVRHNYGEDVNICNSTIKTSCGCINDLLTGLPESNFSGLKTNLTTQKTLSGSCKEKGYDPAIIFKDKINIHKGINHISLYFVTPEGKVIGVDDHYNLSQAAYFSNVYKSPYQPTVSVTQISNNNVYFTGYKTTIHVKNEYGVLVQKEVYIYTNSSITNDGVFDECESIMNSTVTLNLEYEKQKCIEHQKVMAAHYANQVYEAKKSAFEMAYLQQHFNKCLDIKNETFKMKFKSSRHHFTLYYYDQAGNLVQTVPPEGVAQVSVTTANYTNGKYTGSNPQHHLATKYKYNSLNQLIWQYTPDGGESHFWYDDLGRIRLSQNAEQIKTGKYSYSKYNELGQLYEAGQVNNFTVVLTNPALNLDAATIAKNYLNDISFPQKENYTLEQITKTYYSQPLSSSQVTQNNLRNRVAAVVYYPTETSEEINKTEYSYDIHGNVERLWQTIPSLGTFQMDYEYDLLSGKVNTVYFQKGKIDQFMHRYQYDADGRLQIVETSTNGILWNQEARYFYYAHGPLARIELGNQLQGLDYYYTLHGWLKGVNTPHSPTKQTTAELKNTLDLGQDGIGGGLNKNFAHDQMAFALTYYNGDYKSNGTFDLGAAKSSDIFAAAGSSLTGEDGKKGLYNGNIVAMTTSTKNLPYLLLKNKPANEDANNAKFQANYATKLATYQYDQLNRIKASTTFEGHNGSWSNAALKNRFNTSYSYDANGNIDHLTRYSEGNLLDDLSYVYEEYVDSQKLSNKLAQVKDAINTPSITTDIESQNEKNYVYDAIGQLTEDKAEGISIKWNLHNKVSEVIATKNNQPNLEFVYDAMGNRIMKIVKTKDGNNLLQDAKYWKKEYYVRDASGNVMANYERTYKETVARHEYLQTEVPIYGSSRLGIYNANKKLSYSYLPTKNYIQYLGSDFNVNGLDIFTDNSTSTAIRIIDNPVKNVDNQNLKVLAINQDSWGRKAVVQVKKGEILTASVKNYFSSTSTASTGGCIFVNLIDAQTGALIQDGWTNNKGYKTNRIPNKWNDIEFSMTIPDNLNAENMIAEVYLWNAAFSNLAPVTYYSDFKITVEKAANQNKLENNYTSINSSFDPTDLTAFNARWSSNIDATQSLKIIPNPVKNTTNNSEFIGELTKDFSQVDATAYVKLGDEITVSAKNYNVSGTGCLLINFKDDKGNWIFLQDKNGQDPTANGLPIEICSSETGKWNTLSQSFTIAKNVSPVPSDKSKDFSLFVSFKKHTNSTSYFDDLKIEVNKHNVLTTGEQNTNITYHKDTYDSFVANQWISKPTENSNNFITTKGDGYWGPAINPIQVQPGDKVKITIDTRVLDKTGTVDPGILVATLRDQNGVQISGQWFGKSLKDFTQQDWSPLSIEFTVPSNLGISPIYLNSDLWGRKTTTDFDNLVISVNGITKASSYDGNDIGAGKTFKQSYTLNNQSNYQSNQSNSFITHNNTTQTQDTWSPTKKFRVYEGDVVRVNIKIRNRFDINKGMLVVSVRDEKGNPAYPLNDPNYWWFAEKAKKISSGEWETISLNLTIKENYDAKELYVDVATWVLGDKTIDFDDLEVIIDRPVKRIAGKRQYELSNHLGNVLATISDRKIGIDVNSDGFADFYDAQTLSLHDYYPFGMQISARSFQSHEYKYGFQGQERDQETGFDNYKYRMHDPRLGRFFAIDPLAPDYPHNSPYAFSENVVIDHIELEGLEKYPYMSRFPNSDYLNNERGGPGSYNKGSTVTKLGDLGHYKEIQQYQKKHPIPQASTTPPCGAPCQERKQEIRREIEFKQLVEARAKLDPVATSMALRPEIQGIASAGFLLTAGELIGFKTLVSNPVSWAKAGLNFTQQMTFSQGTPLQRFMNVDMIGVSSQFVPGKYTYYAGGFDGIYDFSFGGGYLGHHNKKNSDIVADLALNLGTARIGNFVESKGFLSFRYGVNPRYFTGLNQKGEMGSLLFQQSFMFPATLGNVMFKTEINK